MTERRSFFEPPLPALRAHYLAFWLGIGTVCATISLLAAIQAQLPYHWIASLVLFTVVFTALGPAYAVYWTRRSNALIDLLIQNTTGDATLRKLEIARSVSSLRHWQTAVLAISVFALAVTVSRNVIVGDNISIASPLLFAGGGIGLALASIACVTGLQLIRVMFELPNDAFHTGFQATNNPIVRALQRPLPIIVGLGTVIWLLHLVAFIVAGVASDPWVVLWLSFSSFFPVGLALIVLFRARSIIRSIRDIDLETVRELIASELQRVRARETGATENLNRLLDLQERVARTNLAPSAAGSAAILLSAIAPAIQAFRELGPGLVP